jgi:hypothetical protein
LIRSTASGPMTAAAASGSVDAELSAAPI